MQTRNSPSLKDLHKLANLAQIQDFEKISKSALFKKLQGHDFDRLKRRDSRHMSLLSSVSYSDHLLDQNLNDIVISNNDYSLKKRKLNEVVDDNINNNIQQGKSTSSSSSSSLSSSLEKKYSSNHIKQSINKLDPIMLTSIKKKHSWRYTRPNGNHVLFNLDSLIDFMHSTGDFTDPETRIPFSDDDLEEIDKLAIKAKLGRRSVLQAKRNPQAYVDLKFRRDALQGLDRLAGEVVTDILRIIETCDPEEAQMRLLIRELPLFSDYFHQISDADTPYARQCMKHYKSFLLGPPNRPNDDPYGLIDLVVHFLSVTDSQLLGNNYNHTLVPAEGGSEN